MIKASGGPPNDNEPLTICDGFNDAIVGVGARCGKPDVVIYDYDKMIEVLMKDGMTDTNAAEYISYNILSAWVGDDTPVVMYRGEWRDA